MRWRAKPRICFSFSYVVFMSSAWKSKPGDECTNSNNCSPLCYFELCVIYSVRFLSFFFNRKACSSGSWDVRWWRLCSYIVVSLTFRAVCENSPKFRTHLLRARRYQTFCFKSGVDQNQVLHVQVNPQNQSLHVYKTYIQKHQTRFLKEVVPSKLPLLKEHTGLGHDGIVDDSV